MKRLIAGISIFILICLMGGFVALASGIAWGTRDAGACAVATFTCALVLGVFGISNPFMED